MVSFTAFTFVVIKYYNRRKAFFVCNILFITGTHIAIVKQAYIVLLRFVGGRVDNEGRKEFEMRKILISVIACAVFLLAYAPAHAAGTWIAQNSGIGQDLYDIDFLDSLNGWTVGRYKYILHTTDGGQNWSVQNKITDPDLLMALDMVTPDTGFAGGFYGYMHRTTDGGITWPGQIIIPNTAAMVTDIHFANTRLGWAAGYGARWSPDRYYQYILRTTDGGDNWNMMWADSGTTMDKGGFYGISFADTLNGVAVGYVGNIFSTTNGGLNWTKRSGVTNRTLNAITHVDSLTFVAIGDTGLIIKTTDGGVTWITFSSDSMGYLRAVDFADSSNGWLVGCRQNLPYKGIIMNTMDGGDLWSFQINTDYWLYGVKFINRNFGWACGSMGNIYKYYDLNGVEGNIKETLEYKILNLKVYPNPFRYSIVIKYKTLDEHRSIMGIYDINGRLVKNLTFPKSEDVLSVAWYGDDENGNKLPSGIYFCRLENGKETQTVKLIKLK